MSMFMIGMIISEIIVLIVMFLISFHLYNSNDNMGINKSFFLEVVFPTMMLAVIFIPATMEYYVKVEVKKEQTFTVIEKKDSVSADANISIKPIMIKGSLHQPIPEKEIKNVMRIYDGAKTYTISVDKATYDQYGVNSKMIIDASDEFKLEIK